MTLKLIGAPGHYRPGADTNHCLGRCDECDARYLVKMTLGQVANWGPNGERGKAGTFRRAMFEAYMHLWAARAPRYSCLADGWDTPPTDPEVTELFQELRRAAREEGRL